MSEPDTVPVQADAFTFGEPVPVLDRREVFDFFEVAHNGRWYEPPVSQAGLGRAYRMAPHHQSAILLKRNLLVASFEPTRWLSKTDFARFALDWLVFGNAYLQSVPNLAGGTALLKPSPAPWTRVGLKPDQFFYVQPGRFMADALEYQPGAVFHLMEPDPMQEIYGMPEYLSALQSGLLNESATLFRRKYYLNGSHAGFILYIGEEGLNNADSDRIREALKQSKGPGNFRNLYLHIPKGKEKGVQVIPIAELGAKDEFLGIKEVTRDDMLAAHRVPPQLLGIVPKNAAGFGNVNDAARTFYQMEIVPILMRMLEVNDWLRKPAIVTKEPDFVQVAQAAA